MNTSFAKLGPESEQYTGQTLSEAQLAAFTRYAEMLAEWNARFNLTAITSPDEVRQKHFLDSVSCALVMAGTTISRVIDIGSGAGFPGVPLKIVFPMMHLTLVESVTKKASFLNAVVQDLDLDEVEVLTVRAEQVGQDSAHRETYDWAVARAVARLPTLAEYLLPLVRVGGYALAQKGGNAAQEVELAEDAIQTLGGAVERVEPVALPGVDDLRHLIVIKKISATPTKYPRRAGIPGKRPIGG